MFTYAAKTFSKAAVSTVAIFVSKYSFSHNQITALADGWEPGGNGDQIVYGSNKIEVNYTGNNLLLVTSLGTGSTSKQRMRSIGWFATIKSNDGRSAYAVFGYKGDNANRNYYGTTLSGYSFSWNYVIDQFTKDSGANGMLLQRISFMAQVRAAADILR